MATNIERDLPFLQHGVGPSAWGFFDDFNSLNMSATSALADWTLFETTAGSTELCDLTLDGGVLSLTATTTADVESLIRNSGFTVANLKAGETVYFGCRFKCLDADKNHVHIGLGIHDTSYQASVPTDFVCFQLVSGAATLNLVARKDGASTAASAIATVSDDTWCRMAFAYTPTSTQDIGTLEYVIHSGGTRTTGSINTAGNFPDDVPLFVVIQTQAGDASTDTTMVDWVYVYGTRAAAVDGTG